VTAASPLKFTPVPRVESESGSIREHDRGVSLAGIKILKGSCHQYGGISLLLSGVPDIRESAPTGYPGYLRDIRDIRNQDQGWEYPVLSLISLI
jgi:hypothetical protein